MPIEGAAAAFRSLTPDVQQRIVRQMVGKTPNPYAFNATLQHAQTADTVAEEAMQIYNMLQDEEGAIAEPSMDELIRQGLAEETPVYDATAGASPAYGQEFQQPASPIPTTVAQSPVEAATPEPVVADEAQGEGFPGTTAALAAAGVAYGLRDEIHNRRGAAPRVVEEPSVHPSDVEAAYKLDGGQQRGQMSLLDGSVDLNEELAPNRSTFDPRQSDMQLGDPNQLEFDYNKAEMQPMVVEGKVVGYAELDADGMPKYYDADRKFIGSSLEEVQQNVPMPVDSVEAGKPRIKASVESVQNASTVKEIPDEVIEEAVTPKKKSKPKVAGYDGIPKRKGSQNVERIPGFETKAGSKDTANLATNRRQREQGATRFVDGDAHGSGTEMRTVTNADGTKTNYDIGHARWKEVEYGGKKVIIDTKTKLVYDSKGFQITSTKTLQQLKNTIGRSRKALANAIKVVF
jgi:hypothetical protein